MNMEYIKKYDKYNPIRKFTGYTAKEAIDVEMACI
jgi:hypothetical protein